MYISYNISLVREYDQMLGNTLLDSKWSKWTSYLFTKRLCFMTDNYFLSIVNTKLRRKPLLDFQHLYVKLPDNYLRNNLKRSIITWTKILYFHKLKNKGLDDHIQEWSNSTLKVKHVADNWRSGHFLTKYTSCPCFTVGSFHGKVNLIEPKWDSFW